jgi:hypothetical protein
MAMQYTPMACQMIAGARVGSVIGWGITYLSAKAIHEPTCSVVPSHTN